MNASKILLMLVCPMLMLMSCNGTSKEKQTSETENTTVATNSEPAIDMNVKDKSFDELFQQVDSTEIKSYLSKLMVNEDHTVITAGTPTLYNSMAASWEVMGRYFQKPTTFCLLGANRYTLEFIRKQQTYTMSFFDKQFTGDVMAFGSKSGRNSDKMKESKLTSVQTPSGNMTYKEAKVVIECSLFEITTVNPNDFYTEEGKKFVEDALPDAKDYHKLVFGTITNVWVRK